MAQDSYKRGREDPYFAGLLGCNDTSSRNISRSTSDIGDFISRSFSDVSGKSKDLPIQDSVSDVLEPLDPTAFGTSSRIPGSTSFEFPSYQSDSSFEFGGTDFIVKEFSPHTSERTEENQTVPVLASVPRVEKSFVLNKRKSNLSKIPLPQSAASFYNGFSPQFEIMESCDITMRLNLYLKARKDDVRAGVPGKFLHAVIGQDVSELEYGNNARTNFVYSYLLEAQVLTILSYCKEHALKEAVVEVFNCGNVRLLAQGLPFDISLLSKVSHRGESVYPWVETITLGQRYHSKQVCDLAMASVQGCSCCTLIAEKLFLTSPELLAGIGFSRLLLAGILMDTGNLTSPHCTTEDKYMATLLLNGARRFGSNGLFQIMRYKMYDISDLKVVDILRKEFKKWTRVGKPDATGSRVMVSNIGMSSIGISLEQFLAHEHSSTEEIKYFQQLEKLRLLMIVSGYYDAEKNFKREILVSAESMELMRNLLSFFNSNASHLPLKPIHQPGPLLYTKTLSLVDHPGLRHDMKAFEIDKVTSRKTIERLLEEFGGASKG
ncbi:unnamed protein product [Dovyalis caffra]|uniref:DHHA2 domain-containing protein n=1 Tax=Dovyalis caffra TaxID=77055 RepID=A0AAV1SUL1_9ROSI|nr:unnamed protein product [Dovyalis caffra]